MKKLKNKYAIQGKNDFTWINIMGKYWDLYNGEFYESD